MDLRKIYEIVAEEQDRLHRFYEVLKPTRSLLDSQIAELEWEIEDFLAFIGLANESESMLAAIQRIVHLREDLLLQMIADFSEEKRIEVRERAYVWVSRFYLARFERLLERIDPYLSPFYRALLAHAHRIGKAMSGWQGSWMAQIVYGINRELLRHFNGDEAKVIELLRSKSLFDKGHGGKEADRCYSVLRMREDGSFERLSYAEAFREEVETVAALLQEAIDELAGLEDEHFGQHREWINYLQTIRKAFLERDVDRLVAKWADVDRAWMQIRTPIQLGHPLEYYEDRFRKAVALEWDVRISDPNYASNERARIVKRMFQKLYEELGIEAESIYWQTVRNLDRTQLYVGRPLLFYGSEFNGLFSAQVVPNDEEVSKEYGKKIFAYPDMVLQTQRSKPKMKLGSVVYGKELYERFRRVLERPQIWYRIYDISTIGHEYGHILWMDEESEVAMNHSGQFKNLEEFKATCGGLVSHFLFEDQSVWEYLLEDTLTRAVSLIGWMEVEEVRPYYVEGLLHLHGLFETGVCRFERSLHLDLSKSAYDRLKAWYIATYRDLARVYLKKEDAKAFLDRYLVFEEQILPKSEEVRDFVNYYYDLYKKIGRQVDE